MDSADFVCTMALTPFWVPKPNSLNLMYPEKFVQPSARILTSMIASSLGVNRIVRILWFAPFRYCCLFSFLSVFDVFISQMMLYSISGPCRDAQTTEVRNLPGCVHPGVSFPVFFGRKHPGKARFQGRTVCKTLTRESVPTKRVYDTRTPCLY